jgi:hypothetical protein
MFSTVIKKLLFCPIGAFINWMFVMFRGKYKNYNSEELEDKNFWTGIIFVSLIFTVFQILKICIHN